MLPVPSAATDGRSRWAALPPVADALDGGHREGAHVLSSLSVQGERLDAGEGTFVANLTQTQDGGFAHVERRVT